MAIATGDNAALLILIQRSFIIPLPKACISADAPGRCQCHRAMTVCFMAAGTMRNLVLL